MLKDLIIRKPTPADCESMLFLADDFFKESNWHKAGFEYYKPQSAKVVQCICNGSDDMPALIAVVGGDIIGIAAWNYDHICTKEPMGMGFMFYIHPDARRTPVGVKLMDMAIEQARQDGACGLYFSSTAGFDDDGLNERLFSNMLFRKGFDYIGRCFMKKLT